MVLPLIRPAIIAALGFSFIGAMTSISAVNFLMIMLGELGVLRRDLLI